MRIGDRVKITAGAWAGHQGVIVGVPTAKRCEVKIDGQSGRSIFRLSSLLKVSQ